MTMDHSLELDLGIDQLQQFYSHEFQVVLRINTGLYPDGHPSSYNPARCGLTCKLSSDRQGAKRMRKPISQIVKPLSLHGLQRLVTYHFE